MHMADAKTVLGSSITWIADNMDNDLYDAFGKMPNAEFVIDPEGLIVARRGWSDPDALRSDMERLLGPVDEPTAIADLELPEQRPVPTVAKGIVPRVPMPEGALPMTVTPVLDSTDLPFYAKLRAEGTEALLSTGKGTMYLGFHLDPIYRVHWNNEVDPVQFIIAASDGVTVTPAHGVGPDPEEPADADPREFLVEVDAPGPNETLDVRVQYFACDDALTFCIPVRQDYRVDLKWDENTFWSVRTEVDGTYRFTMPSGRPPL